MFDRFSDDSRRVTVAAHAAASDLGVDYIGPEHLLLGVLAGSDSIAHMVLSDLAVDPDNVRAEVDKVLKRGRRRRTSRLVTSSQLPFTPRGKRVLELATGVAVELGHDYTGTQHLLLGLIQEGEGIAAAVLANLGVDVDAVREAVRRRCPPGPQGPIHSDALVAVLQRAVTEARAHGQKWVDVPHVLLALMDPDHGFATQWLDELGVDLEKARQTLRDVLDEPGKE